MIEGWIKSKDIKVDDQFDQFYVIREKIFKYLPEQTLSISDNQFELNLDKETIDQIRNGEVDFFIYEFGGKFYITPINNVTNLQLVEFRVNSYQPFIDTAQLGIHGRYEIMNGTRDYSDWCVRAKQLGFTSLGIAEIHTLAGTLAFQMACDKAGIKPIIGMSIMIETDSGERYIVQAYCRSEKGWRALLKINKWLNVENQGDLMTEGVILKLLDESDLLVSIQPHKSLDDFKIALYKATCECYYQISTNEYYSQSKEKEVLDNMQSYVSDLHTLIDPILINDSYVIDKDDCQIKETLNKGGGNGFGNQTKNHYFKSLEESFGELSELFSEDDDRISSLFENCLTSLNTFNEIDWKIPTDKIYLPVYEMTGDEQMNFNSNEDLFMNLIEEGLHKVSHHNSDLIMDRIEEELDLITKGGFVNYFLILWDIINWCKEQNIAVGPARGSSAGSLICYLLGITKIDPIRFELLFVRFLNDSRLGTPVEQPDGSIKYVGGELPDIDTDFAHDRREEVFKYIQNRYGDDYFCQVGTYTGLQVRGVIKELARHYGVRGNYIIDVVTKFLHGKTWKSIFDDAMTSKILRGFIKDNPRIINDAKIALNSIKSSSIHACATIIVPKIKGYDGIYDLIPVRRDGDILVSQWEGGHLEKAGFLKEDILSTRQIGKIGHIVDLIETNTGEKIDIYNIPLDDDNVYNLFREGRCQDVFQFGTEGLTAYMKFMQPTDIEDLIAASALYRPGPMSANAHNDYVLLKRGEKEPEYHYLLEEVTKKTMGLIIYQEQIISGSQVLGGMTPLQSEGVRKATGKKILEKMLSYEKMFVDGAIKKGCSEEEANIVWNKIVAFSSYSFNRSHAASYAMISYWCNWFKFHYPLEFWTVAFQFVTKDHISDFVAETRRVGNITIQNPDINKSGLDFYSSKEENTIYWNISEIKFVGDVAAADIIGDREENGDYYSIEDFLERMKGKSPNVRVVRNLIISGAFDKCHLVARPCERSVIMAKLYKFRGEDIPEEYVQNANVDYWWSIQQQEISKLSDINYAKLIKESSMSKHKNQYISSEDFTMEDLEDGGRKDVMICGMVLDVKVKKTKKGDDFAVISIQQDEYMMNVRSWSQGIDGSDSRLNDLREMCYKGQKPLCILRGTLAYNTYTKGNELTVNTRMSGDLFEKFSS